LVGAPNAGKSTLTNALLGQKISIVSPKVQTTRNTIKAIIIDDQTQLVILDTPGIFLPRSDKILERIIVKSAWQGIRDSHFVCFLIDATSCFDKGFQNSASLDRENLRIIKDLRKDGFEPAIIINKVDLIKKVKLLEILKLLSELELTEIFMTSAETGDGLPELKKFLLAKCSQGAWQYDEERITDAPMRATASEITREKLFLKLDQELPYSLTVKTDSYEVFENGEIKIHQTIFVLKESQKKIILGKNGALIKEIGTESRLELSAIVGKRVSLYLFVKVKKDWMNDVESYEMIDVEKVPKNKSK
jgi:GTP-binding protein Era